MKYTEDQLNAIRDYYPSSNYEELFKWFPGKTKREIKTIAHRIGVKSENPGHRKDLTGQQFGRLTALCVDHIDENHKVYWRCVCACGNECVVLSSVLNKGNSRSCGCLKRETVKTNNVIDHTGERFGMLTAIERLPNYKGNKTWYRCICDCGTEKAVSGSSLVTGNTKTCGCISRSRIQFYQTFHKELDDQRPKFLVYKHTAPNKKVYIGITKQNTEKRWQNGNGYNTQSKFWKAIKKYGWDNITHEVVAENLTEKEACELEEKLIEEYKSTDSRYGYNIYPGGNTGRSLVTPVMQYYYENPVNFFESISEAAKLLHVSEGTVSNYITGKTKLEGYSFKALEPIQTYDIDPELYKIRSEKHLGVRKLFQSQAREKTIARNKAHVKRINQYDLDGHYIQTFDSIAEAKRNVSGTGSISAVLRNGSTSVSAGGYQWRYDEGNYDDITPLHINGRSVLQIDPKTYQLIDVYWSMADAERATGVNRLQIFKSCRREHITAGGFIWRYRDDPDAFAPVEKKLPKIHRTPINQYSLDGHYIRSYTSITEAEKQNPDINGIRATVSDNHISKSAGGYMWKKDTGEHKDISPYHANGVFVEMIDLNDGHVIKEFPSIAEAERETGIKNITAVCKGKRHKAGGFAWRYKE